jgi:predicted  nucleic acid-binding Zn-ribbon protein
MHPNLKHLVELQAVDLRLIEVRAALADFPKRLAEIEARDEAARATLAQAKEALTASQKDRKKFELDVEQWKEKARKYKDQSFEVRSNEAYKALQHEIQMAEEEITKAEDRLLERMIAGEEFERQVKAAQKNLTEVEAAGQGERATWNAEKKAEEEELARLEAERDQAVAALPEDLLDHYQRIARRHAGIAVAAVRDETCTICRVRVRPHVFQALRNPTSEEIFHCESCTRILYYLEEEPSSAQSAAVATNGSAESPAEPNHPSSE